MILPADPALWPKGGHDIVYADPPWPYDDPAQQRGGASRHYESMTLAEICALPVANLCTPRAELFLWVTWPNLFMAERVMEAWGFEYKTGGFDWFKTNKDGTLCMGMGHRSRSNSEPCLLAVRAKEPGVRRPRRLPVLDHGIPMAQTARRGKHSAKPAKFRRAIERLYGDVPRVELFAREVVAGWDCWGNELTTEMHGISRTEEEKIFTTESAEGTENGESSVEISDRREALGHAAISLFLLWERGGVGFDLALEASQLLSLNDQARAAKVADPEAYLTALIGAARMVEAADETTRKTEGEVI